MKRIILLIVILGAIGGGIGLYMYNKPPDGVAKKHVDHEVTANVLLADFQSNEESANTKYLGKVVQVEGTIQEIIPGDNLQVILEAGDIMSRVSCVLEEPQAEFQKRGLDSGDQIKLKGWCTGMTMDVVVDRCVVVE